MNPHWVFLSCRHIMQIYITTCHTNGHFLALQCSVDNVLDLERFWINRIVVSLLSWLAMEHQQDVRNHVAVIKHANVVSLFFTFEHGGRWNVVFDKDLTCFLNWYISIATLLSIHAFSSDIARYPYISMTFWFWIKLDAGTMVQSVELVVIPSLWAIIFMLNCYCLSKEKEEKRKIDFGNPLKKTGRASKWLDVCITECSYWFFCDGLTLF